MERFFDNRADASRAAAEHIAGALRRRLDTQDKASLVVSGGSTPADCFAMLGGMPLDWGNVHVIPSDERWVAPEHGDSNERMIRETLLTGAASDAKLLSVYRPDVDQVLPLRGRLRRQRRRHRGTHRRCRRLDELAPFHSCSPRT